MLLRLKVPRNFYLLFLVHCRSTPDCLDPPVVIVEACDHEHYACHSDNVLLHHTELLIEIMHWPVDWVVPLLHCKHPILMPEKLVRPMLQEMSRVADQSNDHGGPEERDEVPWATDSSQVSEDQILKEVALKIHPQLTC